MLFLADVGAAEDTRGAAETGGTAADDPRDAPPARPLPVGRDTLKSRLSDKGSDPQRVDDCGVPPERRGPEPRPVDCAPARDRQ